MYKFKSEEEEIKFKKSLNKNYIAFQKLPQKIKIKAAKFNFKVIYLAQLNERRGVKWYFENIDYYDFLTLSSLNYLCESGLWEFTEYEKSYFLNKHL